MTSTFLHPFLKKSALWLAGCLFLTLLPSFVYAGNAQAIVCSGGQNGRKLISVSYDHAGGNVCKTYYNAGDGQPKQIARAQNSTEFCTSVAYRLMTKLTKAGLNCKSDLPLTHIASSKQYRTTRHHAHHSSKPKRSSQYVDEAFLESIKK